MLLLLLALSLTGAAVQLVAAEEVVSRSRAGFAANALFLPPCTCISYKPAFEKACPTWNNVYSDWRSCLRPPAAPPAATPQPQKQEDANDCAVCRRVGSDNYCAFTSYKFNGGAAVSMITTPARMRALLGGKEPGEYPGSPGSIFARVGPDAFETRDMSGGGPPFEAREITYHGLGLVATRPIRENTRLMAAAPVVMVDDRAWRGMRREDLAVVLGQAVMNLPEESRERFLGLSSENDLYWYNHITKKKMLRAEMKGHWKRNDTARMLEVFRRNAFKTQLRVSSHEGEGEGEGEGELVDFQSVFPEVSRLNHDCGPNLGYYFDAETLSHRVYAARDIMPGEELTISYVDVLLQKEDRHHLLSSTWSFVCTCARCNVQGDGHLAVETSRRVRHIADLRRELDDYSKAATPQKAELLITLYELEGVAPVRIYEAYYRAALEYNGVGDAATATRYARMCLAKGLVLRGPNRPFIESMNALAEDPTRHWSWQFRIYGGSRRPGEERYNKYMGMRPNFQW